MSRRVVVALTVLGLVVVVAGGLVAWRALAGTPYQQALSTMPASTLRATFTDWADVRAEVGRAPEPDADDRSVEDFLDRAYDADLVSTSAIYAATAVMADRYDFSPLDATWEMFGQSREGAVVALKLPPATDFAGIEDNLRSLGYDVPADGAGSGGVWAGSVDLVAQIDPSLTPVMQNVVVLPDEQLVLLSDSDAYASATAEVVTGAADSLADTDGVGDLGEAAGEPVAATMWASDFACEDLSMADADAEDQARADQLVEAAGEISPLSGLVLARQPDGTFVVGMQFESADQAEENLRARARLAAGEAVGQGGSFADRFAVTSAKTSGSTVLLELKPRRDEALLSDLSQGPVVFATC